MNKELMNGIENEEVQDTNAIVETVADTTNEIPAQVRANKITINLENDLLVAKFYRTHKMITAIKENETGFEATLAAMTDEERGNKNVRREAFRRFIIDIAPDLGIKYQPEDLRAINNIRKATYPDDTVLAEDVVDMLAPDMDRYIEKCPYDITLVSIGVDDIVPMTKTAKGVELSTLGIEDGKYAKNGNWAWATINTMTALSAAGADSMHEIYLPLGMQLVSGQLKKPKLTQTDFNITIKAELISVGILTEDKKAEDSAEDAEKPGEDIADTDVGEDTDITEDAGEDTGDTSDDMPDTADAVEQDTTIMQEGVVYEIDIPVKNKRGKRNAIDA